MGHRDVSDAAFAEERALALIGAIDELIDHHKTAGRSSSLNEPQAESATRSVTLRASTHRYWRDN